MTKNEVKLKIFYDILSDRISEKSFWKFQEDESAKQYFSQYALLEKEFLTRISDLEYKIRNGDEPL